MALQAARARPGLVARHAGQSAEGLGGLAAAGRARRGGAGARRPSAHRGDRLRGSRSAPATPSTRSPTSSGAARACVSSGSWAPTTGELPPLARLARDRRADADRRHRPAGLDPDAPPARAAAVALGPLPDRREPTRRRCRTCAPPAWVFLHGPRSALSSTALRQHGDELLLTGATLKIGGRPDIIIKGRRRVVRADREDLEPEPTFSA